MKQTKFAPIFQHMGIPHWRVSHLSDIPYMFAGNVTGGGDNSAAQQDLSTLLSGSAAAFAYTGDPTASTGQSFKDWPLAYRGQSLQASETEYPDELSLYVVGGPYGSGPAIVASGKGSRIASERDKALAWEKLVERCRFINSIRDEIGV